MKGRHGARPGHPFGCVFAFLLFLAIPAAPAPAFPVAQAAPATHADPHTVHVFFRDMIHFLPGDSARFARPEVTVADKGREIRRAVDLGSRPRPGRVVARVTLHPVPKDASSVHDPWDRAGAIRLRLPGSPDLELVKFITAYGGETEHTVDVTDLAAILEGPCTFVAFVDTWLSPAWRIDLSLEFRPGAPDSVPGADPLPAPADWVRPLVCEQGLTAERAESAAEVEIPADLSRIEVRYLVSGHCTDGMGADEFESKPNVILMDGTEVERYLPWRQDCRRFREINPYCRRWADGSWSADYDRSGWCPGDLVPPRRIAVPAAAAGGRRSFTFRVEDIRPRNEKGDHGYWRVSAVLLGWR